MTIARTTTGTIAGFIGGALLVNAVPHTLKGLTGARFPTPFAKPPGVGLSSPTENVGWGAINLAAGSALLHWRPRTSRDEIAVVAGGVAMAFFLAHYFGGLNLDLDNGQPAVSIAV